MSGEQGSVARDETITITYAVRDRVWADWIAEQVEKAGCATILDAWRPEYDQMPLDRLVEQHLEQPGRTLVIVTANFLIETARGAHEWPTVVHAATRYRDRFVSVLVGQDPLKLPEQFWLMNPVRLFRVRDGDVARERLLRDLGLAEVPGALQYPTDEDQRRYPGRPTPVVSELPHRNAAFTGRRDLLDNLREVLMNSESAAPVALGLQGLGGTGKTQLALEYVYRFMHDYDVVWWIPARHRMTVRTWLKRLAVALGAPDVAEEVGTRDDFGEHVRFALERLRMGAPYSRWLLVYDDVEEDNIADYLPLLPNGPGRVIITTRDQNWSQHARPIPVQRYKREESVIFLQRRAVDLTDADAGKLAEWAGDLPLALKQIGAIAALTNKSADDLITLFDSQPLAVSLGETPEDRGGYEYTVATTWITALNLLYEKWEVPAADVLKTLAFFSPDPVPVDWFARMPDDAFPAQKLDLASPAQLKRTVQAITAHSLADDAGSEGEPRLQMHQMVQKVVRDKLDPEEQATYRRAAQLILAGVDPGDPSDRENFGVYARLLPHFGGTMLTSSPEPAVHQLIQNAVRYLQLRGEYETCRRLTESATQPKTEGEPIADWQFVVRRQHALSLRGLGRFTEANAEDQALYDDLMSAPEPDQNQVLNVASGLSGGFREIGRYPEAAELARGVLDGCRRLHGDEEHPEVLRARHNAAIDLRVAGRFAEAYEEDQATYAARRRVLGESHYQTLLTGDSLARDLRCMGRYAAAVAMQEDIYLATLDALGSGSTYTFEAMIELAICRRRAGQYQAAFDIAVEAHDHCVARFGARHPMSVITATNLSGDYRHLDRIDEGLPLAESAAEAAAALYPESHAYRAACNANKAILLRESGAPELARDIDTDATGVLVHALGENHPSALACKVNLASDYAALGDLDRAVEIGRWTLDRLTAARGAGHPHTLVAATNLAADLETVDPAAGTELRRSVRETVDAGMEGLSYSELVRKPQRRFGCDLDLPMW